MPSSLSVLRLNVANNLNFFRVHLLLFTFVPLIASAIFYAANGATFVPFIDVLFACFSATTVCGLVTVDLSSLTGFQQAILFVLTSMGHHVVVSWAMVYVRKRYFAKHLRYIIESEVAKRDEQGATGGEEEPLQRFSEPARSRESVYRSEAGPSCRTKLGSKSRISATEVIQHDPTSVQHAVVEPYTSPIRSSALGERLSRQTPHAVPAEDDDTSSSRPGLPTPRNTTLILRRRVTDGYGSFAVTVAPEPLVDSDSKNTGFGGFPYPTTLLFRLFRKSFAGFRQIFQSDESPFPPSIRSRLASKKHDPEGGKPKSPFMSLFGWNSKFYGLTPDDLAELGGVEYRALNTLLWIIAVYHLGTQILTFIIIAPYMSLQRWDSVFSPPNLHRHIPSTWFSAFQIMSAFTTSGMSLVDQSMVPFQTAYPLVFVCAYLILAGNLAYPCFLRFFIWATMKLTPNKTRFKETLQFLLRHPRRCYLYLFPSGQTWFLLSIVLFKNILGYIFFLTLDIGGSTFEAIPLGVRFAIGVLQVIAIRAAGFATMSLRDLAPAMLVFCVVMMYLAIYPIALSVRTTNVYEERSLGVFGEDEVFDQPPQGGGPEPAKYWKYFAWHARKQLAFDMWWLGLVLFILCVVERHKIQDNENFAWFTVFSLIFEIISAYAGVGISLGLPYANYSFSGALSTLSKIILIMVMIRGRHRDLPLAIDRAVMLPHEYKNVAEHDGERETSVRISQDDEKNRNFAGDKRGGSTSGAPEEKTGERTFS